LILTLRLTLTLRLWMTLLWLTLRLAGLLPTLLAFRHWLLSLSLLLLLRLLRTFLLLAWLSLRLLTLRGPVLLPLVLILGCCGFGPLGC
jgi:hypothetical protein